MSVRPLGTNQPDEPTPEQPPEQTPMASPAQDVRRLKQNSGAVASELRDFLGRMEGRSPREVLGEIASSSLFKSFISSTFLVAIGVVVLTVAPWAWGKFVSPPDADVPEEVAEQGQPSEEESTEEIAAETDQPAEATENTDPVAVDPDDPNAIADRLGVNEVLEAPSNVNPLESSTDDLLKDLE